MFKKRLQYFNHLWYDLVSIVKSKRRGVYNMAQAKLKPDLESLANDILVKNDMLKIPVDLIKIASNNNIDVYYQDLDDNISGAIRYNSELDKFQILLQKKDSERRRRFTLAHELGHFFLDGEKLKQDDLHIDYLYRQVGYTNEKDIDYFAGALLMDKELLEKLFAVNPFIKDLADTFEVSESAMTVRLNVLGLI